MAEAHPKPHAIVFPYPFQGHITPAINLAVNLASNGFTITYVQIEFIHHTIAKAHDHDHGTHDDTNFLVEARKSGLDMHYATISDGFPLEFDRNVNPCEYWESMILDFPARVDKLVGSIVKSTVPATAFFLIADSMFTWPSSIAMKHNLVHGSLWTGSAAMFSLHFNSNHLREKDHSPNYVGSGGVPSITTNGKMSRIQEHDALSLLLEKIVAKAFEQVKNADFALCNTVQELESETLSALNRRQPTYAVGPINFFVEITKASVGKSLFRGSDCTEWLGSKPPGSVLYISFGSISQINEQEIMEIAHGLAPLSEVNFIWVLKNENALPIGFSGRVKDRGLIVPWCDQATVLSSPAIVGFMTHCGWNSILESMWNGVPMICHPIMADQPTNRKLAVEDWRIGIDLCDHGGQVTRKEVGSKIKMLMMGDTCIELRQEMKKVREKMRNALDKGGSSRRNFGQFVHDLKARFYGTTEDGSKS